MTNKDLQELFVAFYFNDIDRILEIKNQKPDVFDKKSFFPINECTHFDLMNLTVFNKIIWFDNDWSAETIPLVLKQRDKTTQVLDFWKQELKQDNICKNIEYNHYFEYFYCEDPEDNTPSIAEDILDSQREKFREIDIQLYDKVIRFDFRKVEVLLNLGANSGVDFDNGGNDTAFLRIYSGVSFLATSQVIPEFKHFEKHGYLQCFNTVEMFRYIIGLAAHQEMLNLLLKYDNKQ